jgi:hypothetical protein
MVVISASLIAAKLLIDGCRLAMDGDAYGSSQKKTLSESAFAKFTIRANGSLFGARFLDESTVQRMA